MKKCIDKEKMTYILGFIILFLLQLITTVGGKTDDVYFKAIGLNDEFNYWEWIKYVWEWRSSRIIINILSISFNVWPIIIWKIFNAFVLITIPYCVSKLSGIKPLMPVIMIFMFPYIILGEAGWVVTGLNYSFPAAAMLVSFVILKDIITNKKPAVWLIVIGFLCAVVASDAEQSSLIMLFVFASICILTVIKKYPGFYYSFVISIITIFRFVLVFLCPGNSYRKINIGIPAYPYFEQMNYFDMFKSGVYAVLDDTFLIFFCMTFLLCLITMITVFRRHKSCIKRCISIIPFAFVIGFPVYLIIRMIMIWSGGLSFWLCVKTILVYYGILGNCNTVWLATPVAVYVLFILVYIFLFASLFLCFDDYRTGLLAACAIILGCFAKGSLGFTPSVWYSHSRTGFYIALGEMIALALLYKNASAKADNEKNVLTLRLSFGILATLNLIVSCYLAYVYAKAGSFM